MNREKLLYNTLLRKYFKNLRRLHSLRAANKNERRQGILSKHIERLLEKLKSLQLSLKRSMVASTIAFGAVAMMPQTANAQSFDVMQTNPFGLQNVGGYGKSNPTLGDIDGDGDLDMISGQYDYDFYSYNGFGNFMYYENTGSNTNPSFAAPQTNPFGLTSVIQYEGIAPTLVDIDGDGDLDVILNNNNGDFLFYENTGSSTAPAFAAPLTNPFSLSLGLGRGNSQPSFADLDNDGDLDLIIGNDINSSLLYFENTGSINAPLFGAAQTNPFSINPVGGSGYLYHPKFIDLDGDGDFDILAGTNYNDYDYSTPDGVFMYFENTGTQSAPVFAAEVLNPFGLTGNQYSFGLDVADIDADGDLDIIAGEDYYYGGDFFVWEGCSPTTNTITTTDVCEYTAPSGAVYTASGTYTDVIPNATNCDSIITINLTVEPIADIAFTDDAITICDNEQATIQLSSSQNNVDYYLRNDLNDTIVDGPIVGDGGVVNFSTGNLTTSSTYNVYAENLVPTTGLFFDGGFDFGDASGINIANSSFTIEFYAKRTTTGNDDYIVSQGTSNSNDGLHIGFRGSNQFTFAFFGNDLNTTNTYTNNDWHHYAVTYDNTTGDRTIYIDGIVEGTDNSASAFTGTGTFRIGTTMWTAPFGSDAYEGNLDELRIWNTARSQTEINDNMKECLTGTETGLISYYQFEDGSGLTVTDETANGNDFSIYNNTEWSEGSSVCSTCNIEMTQTATVTVNPPLDITVTNDETVLTANLGNASYQWLDCDDNNSPITGETGETFTPSANGNYAVEITATGCTDTSACEAITILNLGENDFGANIKIYPNPSSGDVNIQLGQTKAVQIKLLSLEGREVFEDNVNTSNILLDVSTYPQGVYILRISDGQSESFHKIIKK